MTFVSILKKTPCYTTFIFDQKNNFFKKTHFRLKQFRAENSFRKINLKLSLCSNNWTLNTDFIIKSSRIHPNPPTRSLAPTSSKMSDPFFFFHMSQKKFEIFPIRKNIFSQLSIVVAWRLQKEPKFYVGVDSIKFVSVRKHTVPG